MKIILIAGAAALALGVLGGSAVSGLRVKGEVMEAIADSLAAAAPEDGHAPGGATSHDGAADDAHATDADTTASLATEADTTAALATEADTTAALATEAGTTAALATEADSTETETAEHLAENVPEDSGAGDIEPDLTLVRGLDSEGAGSLEEGEKKLAKIFAQMKPDDAAAVLEHLSDEEIESILQHMSERSAAPILQAFDPVRAAALSRILLHSGSSGS